MFVKAASFVQTLATSGCDELSWNIRFEVQPVYVNGESLELE